MCVYVFVCMLMDLIDVILVNEVDWGKAAAAALPKRARGAQ